MPNSPNMGLSILTPSVTTGPGWATSLESDKLLLDAHTHVSGQGVPVPTAGLNINANLPLGGHNLQHAGTLGLDNQTTTASGITASIFYAYQGDIWWNNGSSVPVQLTSGSAIAASSIGGITNLAGTSAALTYSQALTTFIATADVGKSAALDAGAVTIRQTNTSSAKGVTLSSPASLGADYTITLPTAVPSTSGIMVMGATGATAVRTLVPAVTSGVLLVGPVGEMSVANQLPATDLFTANQFAAYRNAAFNIGGNNAVVAFIPDTVYKDTGGGYNTANGIYTIPASGTWWFSWSATADSQTVTGSYVQTRLVINSGVYAPGINNYVSGANQLISSAGSALYCNALAGDKVKVDITIPGGSAGKTSMQVGSGVNWFHGFQVR